MPTSPLHADHQSAGARFTDFGGWTMPLRYIGVLKEHAAVRTRAGIFDVSHLGRFDVEGDGSTELLRSQLCNDIALIPPGRAQYTMALNDGGGVEDDIIVWRLDDDHYRVMPNGTNFDGIVDRFTEAAPSPVTVNPVRSSTALLAVQGPTAREIVEATLGFMPGRFRVSRGTFAGRDVVVAGTGYTGERGAEICIAREGGSALWGALTAAGATPAGLGARDTLRLEMGYPLWGQDLGPDTSPIEAGLERVIAWDHDFVGRDMLLAQRGTPRKLLIAFITEGRAIPRHGYRVQAGDSRGAVTSGNFSPTLGHGIALAYLTPPPLPDAPITVMIRGDATPATRVSLPFLEK
ncbi:MAG: glycine cleavage system aminomethyltransferase GcvT [Actinomycetota bacterium]|nr:glycine cleavage system aminomethyltransferase GcvT [Actinomycetota bacterium]